MTACRHPIAKVVTWNRVVQAWPGNVVITTKHCDACRADLGLGPARDTADTAVELRAAAIVAALAERRRTQPQSKLSDVCDSAEIAGWIKHLAFDAAQVPEQDGEIVGWLAREICEHDKEQRC